MDIVVYLALIVLAAVFLFSLFILIVICRRRYEYNRLLVSQSLRFSKLRQENMEDIEQLGPHLSQALNRNMWMEEITTGLLQHCVAVLKLSHSLTDKMAKIPLEHCAPELNQLICKATARVVPRFEALLRSMAANNVDIRIIEARVAALVSACWALTAPFSMANPKQNDHLSELLQQMEHHLAVLQLALEKSTEFEEEQLQTVNETGASTSSGTAPPIGQVPQSQTTAGFTVLTPNGQQKTMPNGQIRQQDGQGIDAKLAANSLRKAEDEATSSLLNNDEAPADPAIT